MTLSELLVKIGFQVDDAPLKKVESALASLNNKIELIGSIWAASRIWEAAESFAKWGQQLNSTAQNLGLTTDELQKLQFAASKSGTSAEMMTHSLAILSRQLYAAQSGSQEAAMAFARIGITGDQLSNMHDMQQALFIVADKIAALPNAQQKMAVAMHMLGRSGYQMVDFLNQGSNAIRRQEEEAQRLGLILSGPQIRALEETAQSFTKLHAIIQKFGAMIASNVGPLFTFLIDKFIEFYGANKNVINVGIEKFLEDLAYDLGFVAGFVYSLSLHFINLAKSLGINREIVNLGIRLFGIALVGYVVIGVFNMIESVFAKVIGTVFGLSTSIISLTGSLVRLGIAIAPILPLAATLAAIVVAGHDLYALFTGKQTWIEQFAHWLSTLQAVRKTLEYIDDFFTRIAASKVGQMIAAFGNMIGIHYDDKTNPLKMGLPHSKSTAAGSPTSATGSGSETSSSSLASKIDALPIPSILKGELLSKISSLENAQTNIGAVTAPSSALSSSPSTGGSSQSIDHSQVYNYNINMPISVPSGTNLQEVGEKVKDHIREHLERLQRETSRSTQSVVAY